MHISKDLSSALLLIMFLTSLSEWYNEIYLHAHVLKPQPKVWSDSHTCDKCGFDFFVLSVWVSIIQMQGITLLLIHLFNNY